MLNFKKAFHIRVACESDPDSLYQRLLRKARLKDCERGDITFDIKIECDRNKPKKPRKAGTRKKK